jgi:putative N-acetylmannosamine-6-phosphate epimerase
MELTMTEVKLNLQHQEIIRTYITHLLEQLTEDYQRTKAERQQIYTLVISDEDEFTVLEELELLTTTLRGYASQIQFRGWIENEAEAIEQLQAMYVLDVSAIAQFYFTTPGQYEQVKAYIRMLDYLRLLMLDYLRSNSIPKAS